MKGRHQHAEKISTLDKLTVMLATEGTLKEEDIPDWVRPSVRQCLFLYHRPDLAMRELENQRAILQAMKANATHGEMMSLLGAEKDKTSRKHIKGGSVED